VTAAGTALHGDGAGPSTGAVALEVVGAVKTFGATRALAGVDLRVHPGSVTALLGANGSGKSTLIRALAGYHELDEGTIEVHGRAPGEADAEGMALRFVHQDLALIPTLSIADNLALGRGYVRDRFGSIRWRDEQQRVSRQLEDVGVRVDPQLEVQELGPVDRTLVAIARALESIDTRNDVLVLDEPTARLPAEEAVRLIDRLKALKARGLPILYITHRLEELRGFADHATVLRDGHEVYSGRFDALPFARLRELIAGLEPGTGDKPTQPTAPQPRTADVALRLRGVASERLRDIDLEVHAGEIVAVTGLVGSGRSELGRVVYGLQGFGEGEVAVGERAVAGPGTSKARTALDVGYLPQERVASLLAGLSVRENVVVASFDGMSSWYGLVSRRLRDAADEMIRLLQIRPPDPDGLVDVMSGGNAQKVAVARWLRIPLSLLVLDEPTQSIDVGAKTDLMEAIRDRARATGMGVLWLESDIEELVKYADRVLVMADGRIETELTDQPFSVAEIVAHSYGRERPQGAQA
jgi:ribose transport system ATP-binding protein